MNTLFMVDQMRPRHAAMEEVRNNNKNGEFLHNRKCSSTMKGNDSWFLNPLKLAQSLVRACCRMSNFTLKASLMTQQNAIVRQNI